VQNFNNLSLSFEGGLKIVVSANSRTGIAFIFVDYCKVLRFWEGQKPPSILLT